MSATPAYSRLAGVYDELVVDPCYSQWAQFLDELWADEPPASVLDVCCGTGLMTAELVDRGMDVTGIDASPQMLARARVLLGPDVALEEVVLPDLPLDRTFDAAVSTLDGLNYLTPADFARTMEALAQRIRPGGWLVFDLHADAAMRLLEDNPVIEGEDDGRRFVLRSTVDRTSRTCSTTIELTAPDPADSFTEEHVQHVHADSDVRTALAAAGFELASVTDEYTHEPVTGGTLRATWVSRRSGG